MVLRLLQSVVLFEPNDILFYLHNDTIRFGGGNTFKLPGDLADLSTVDFNGVGDLIKSDEGKYYAGLVAGSIATICTLGIWLCLMSLTCLTGTLRFCLCIPVPNWLKALVFEIALLMSLFGFFFSVQGHLRFQDGLDVTHDTVNTLNTSLEKGSELFELAFSTQLDDLSSKLVSLEGDCGTSDNLLTLSDMAASFSSFQISLQDAQVLAHNLSTATNGLLDLTDQFAKYSAPVYLAFTILLVVIIFLFLIAATIEIAHGMEIIACIRQTFYDIFKRFHDFTLCGFYSCGFATMLSVMVFCIIISPIARVGSDVCIPDFSQSLQNAFSNGLDTDFCQLPSDDLNETERFGNLLCYYGECRGDNIIFQRLGVISSDDNNTLIQNSTDNLFLDELSYSLEELNDASQPACINSIAATKEAIVQVAEVIDTIHNAYECASITQVYLQAVNDGVCNGIASGLGAIFICWIIGVSGYMGAMYCYLIIDPYENDKEMFSVNTRTLTQLGENKERSSYRTAQLGENDSHSTKRTNRVRAESTGLPGDVDSDQRISSLAVGPLPIPAIFNEDQNRAQPVNERSYERIEF